MCRTLSPPLIHLSEPTYDFDQWGEMLPAHLEAPVFEAATEPGSYIQHSLYNREPLNPGLYNGPYRITAIETGSQIVLERNEHWTGARPYFDRLVIRTIGNTAALQANLLSGDVDMVPGDGAGLTLDQVLSLQAQYIRTSSPMPTSPTSATAISTCSSTTRCWPTCGCAGRC